MPSCARLLTAPFAPIANRRAGYQPAPQAQTEQYPPYGVTRMVVLRCTPFASSTLLIPSRSTNTGTLPGGTLAGTFTLICHTPTNPGASPENSISLCGTKSELMKTLMSLLVGSSRVLGVGCPSGGMPLTTPWPVP